MPNQLSKSKRRQSLAEHEAVLAALGKIATAEKTTVMALLREAARDLVKRRAAASPEREAIHKAALELIPEMPRRFKTPAEVARFKREQREFDRALLDMGLARSEDVQARNSVIPAQGAIRMINFAHSHAATPL